MKKYFIILTVCSLVAANSFAQIQLEWSFIHYPLGNSQNQCAAKRDQLRLLSNGDLICGWWYEIANPQFSAIGVSSYDQNGGFNWEDYYGSTSSINQFKSIEVDSADNIYMMGVVNSQSFAEDNVIIKYDLNGNQIWLIEDDSVNTNGESTMLIGDRYYLQSRVHPSLYRFDLNGNAIDTIGIDSITPGINGSVLPRIAHMENQIFYGSSFYTVTPLIGMLYAAKALNGDSIIWKTIVDATPAEEEVVEIAPDHAGNLYMTALGNRLSASDAFIFTCAFDSQTGDTLWTMHKHALPGHPSYPSDIDVDNAGHVYVAGNIYNGVTSRAEAALIQYDAVTGQEKWTVTMDSSFAYWIDIVKISIDTLTKEVYFAYTYFPIGGNYATVMSKIDSTGTIIWKRYFNNVASAEAFFYDQNGHLFIAGGSMLSKFSITTDVNEFASNKTQLKVFPDPITDHFRISTDMESSIAEVTISDLTGQVFYKSAFQSNAEINCEKWPSGFYFVNAYTIDGTSASFKLIKL